MNSKIAKTDQELARSKGQLEKTKAEADKLKNQNKGLSKELKRAMDIANARKKIVGKIAKAFKDAGVDAGIDGKTGDVTLSFSEFFDTGRALLKPSMRESLKKFMPHYSKSLFADPEISKKIKSVEIIGFASPTYGGRVINPNSLSAKDKKARDYNLKLSFKRAEAIYKYIFDRSKLSYDFQKDLLPLVKVTGRSFFAGSKEQYRDVASGMTRKQFCQRYDCKKEQKVIIKFNLDN